MSATKRMPAAGGGIAHPTWPKCPNHAAWGLYGHQHGYCTTHAAKRLRAKANLAAMQAAAETRRAAFNPGATR